MANTSFVVVALMLFHVVVCDNVVVNLNGNWTVLNNAKGYKMCGEVPGSMYTALYNNKLIPDPLYRDNDVKLKWIGEEDWTYTRNFQLSSTAMSSGSILLVCDGLDTFSTVFINDQIVGSSENMFVQYVYNIKNVTKLGTNTIRVEFRSAVKVAEEKFKLSSYIPNYCISSQIKGKCHINMIRKEQCSFSWDWGPSFPTQGIWKDIYVRAFNTATIRELSVTANLGSTGEWEVDVAAHFDVSGGSVSGSLNTQIIGTTVTKSQPVILSPSNNSVIYTVTIPKGVPVERWWPNGYGNQTLYIVNVTFTSGSEVSTKSRRVGFRTVELVQDPIGKDQGLTFYFKINGIPVFLKGTNWVPSDSFLERETNKRLYIFLKSAAEVHINAIVVFGGGIYESDYFYDLTDELGIMVLQQMMFSVALYPTTPEFLNTVKQEVTHQVRRLRHHASIILWSGNDENAKGLRQNWFGITHDFQRFYDEYITLYVKTFMPILQKEDPARIYLTTNPSDGKETIRQNYIAKDPGSVYFGDIHYYNYTADMWRDSIYLIPRFTSEFGVQAWCNPETLEDVFQPSDFNYWGYMASHRNHHANGSQQMMSGILQHFKAPTNPDTKQRFKDLIYLTQINQAVSVQAETEHYRRWQNDLTSDGRGQTMGALYWQLDDIWQAPTWASIDYKGKWKMLHYYVRKFFAPILISPYLNGTNLMVSMVIDELPMLEVKDTNTGINQFGPATNYINLLKSGYSRKELIPLLNKRFIAVRGTLFVEMYRWDNIVPLKTWNTTYRLTRSSELVYQQDVSSLVRDSNCPGTSSCFLHFYVNDKNSDISASLPLTYYKSVQGLAKPTITIIEITRQSQNSIMIKLVSNCIAPFVWVDAKGFSGRFSDNGFLMLTPSKTIVFTAWDPVSDIDLFKNSMSVQSLMDIDT